MKEYLFGKHNIYVGTYMCLYVCWVLSGASCRTLGNNFSLFVCFLCILLCAVYVFLVKLLVCKYTHCIMMMMIIMMLMMLRGCLNGVNFVCVKFTLTYTCRTPFHTSTISYSIIVYAAKLFVAVYQKNFIFCN